MQSIPNQVANLQSLDDFDPKIFNPQDSFPFLLYISQTLLSQVKDLDQYLQEVKAKSQLSTLQYNPNFTIKNLKGKTLEIGDIDKTKKQSTLQHILRKILVLKKEEIQSDVGLTRKKQISSQKKLIQSVRIYLFIPQQFLYVYQKMKDSFLNHLQKYFRKLQIKSEILDSNQWKSKEYVYMSLCSNSLQTLKDACIYIRQQIFNEKCKAVQGIQNFRKIKIQKPNLRKYVLLVFSIQFIDYCRENFLKMIQKNQLNHSVTISFENNCISICSYASIYSIAKAIINIISLHDRYLLTLLKMKQVQNKRNIQTQNKLLTLKISFDNLTMLNQEINNPIYLKKYLPNQQMGQFNKLKVDINNLEDEPIISLTGTLTQKINLICFLVSPQQYKQAKLKQNEIDQEYLLAQHYLSVYIMDSVHYMKRKIQRSRSRHFSKIITQNKSSKQQIIKKSLEKDDLSKESDNKRNDE